MSLDPTKLSNIPPSDSLNQLGVIKGPVPPENTTSQTAERALATSTSAQPRTIKNRSIAIILTTLAFCLAIRYIFQQKTGNIPEYSPTRCAYDIEEMERFEKKIHDGLDSGALKKTCQDKGLCWINQGDRRVALFKPENTGGLFGPGKGLFSQHAKASYLQEPENMRYRGVYTGDAVTKQEVVPQFDYGDFACLPKGISTDLGLTIPPVAGWNRIALVLRLLLEEQLGYRSYWDTLLEMHDRDKGSHTSEPGFLQMYVPQAHTLQTLGKDFLDEAPLDELQKMNILDFMFGNIDRHEGNILIRQEEGKAHLIPIDWDLCLSLEYPSYENFYTLKRSKEPFTPASRAYLRSLDPELVALTIREAGLPREVALSAKLHLLVLQHVDSIAEAYEFQVAIQNGNRQKIDQWKFIKLWTAAILEAEAKLSLDDLENYREGERIEKKIHLHMRTSEEDRAWYQTYEKEIRNPIVDLLEKEITAFFIKGLPHLTLKQSEIYPDSSNTKVDSVDIERKFPNAALGTKCLLAGNCPNIKLQ